MTMPSRSATRSEGQDTPVPTQTDFLDSLPTSTPRHDQRPDGMHEGCDCGAESVVAELAVPDPWRRGFTRRRVLQGTTAMVAALGTQAVTTRYAFAATKALDTDTVVVISMRGGWDGLNIVAPTFEDRYYQVRPNIAVPQAAGLPLARGFALHPELKQLHGLYQAGKLGVVHAVGTPDRTLSHFEAMDTCERGTGKPGTSDGWLNRVLQARGDDGVFSAVQMGGGSLPLALSGEAPALAMGNVQSFGLMGFDDVKAQAASAFAALYKGIEHPMADQVRNTVAAMGKASSLPATPDANAKAYPPGSGFAAALQDIARLVKGKLGLSIATLDVGGWDMHTNEGRIDNGDLKNHMAELDAALGAFVADLGPAFANVTVVTLTEFGRTVFENGAVGTDHGHAFPMFVLGGGIKGGDVYGAWPGLDDKNLFVNSSLAARTDYRDVLGEVLAKRAKVGSFAKVFPDHRPKLLGVANAR
jgi:uncharacterized protein (DUF1501 family)